MEYYTMLRVRETWGDKECDHPRLEKIYYTGAFLISYACVQCGKEFTIAEKMDLSLERKRKASL
jgi:hypothetical protein